MRTPVTVTIEVTIDCAPLEDAAILAWARQASAADIIAYARDAGVIPGDVTARIEAAMVAALRATVED